MSHLGYFAFGLGLLAGSIAAMAAVLFGAAGTFAVPCSGPISSSSWSCA